MGGGGGGGGEGGNTAMWPSKKAVVAASRVLAPPPEMQMDRNVTLQGEREADGGGAQGELGRAGMPGRSHVRNDGWDGGLQIPTLVTRARKQCTTLAN
jgi:hypothetical protein